MSQLIPQPFFRFSCVTGFSLTSPGEPPMVAIHLIVVGARCMNVFIISSIVIMRRRKASSSRPCRSRKSFCLNSLPLSIDYAELSGHKLSTFSASLLGNLRTVQSYGRIPRMSRICSLPIKPFTVSTWKLFDATTGLS